MPRVGADEHPCTTYCDVVLTHTRVFWSWCPCEGVKTVVPNSAITHAGHLSKTLLSRLLACSKLTSVFSTGEQLLLNTKPDHCNHDTPLFQKMSASFRAPRPKPGKASASTSDSRKVSLATGWDSFLAGCTSSDQGKSGIKLGPRFRNPFTDLLQANEARAGQNS